MIKRKRECNPLKLALVSLVVTLFVLKRCHHGVRSAVAEDASRGIFFMLTGRTASPVRPPPGCTTRGDPTARKKHLVCRTAHPTEKASIGLGSITVPTSARHQAQVLLPPSEKECHNDGEDPVPKFAQLHSDEPMSLPFLPRLHLLQGCAISICAGAALSLQGLLPPKAWRQGTTKASCQDCNGT
jgi:hypothetical protein